MYSILHIRSNNKFSFRSDVKLNKYQCTDENGDYRDYWELVNENSEFCNEIEHLQQENKKYKEVIDKALNDIDLVIELIKQQPTEDDSWI